MVLSRHKPQSARAQYMQYRLGSAAVSQTAYPPNLQSSVMSRQHDSREGIVIPRMELQRPQLQAKQAHHLVLR